MYCFVLCCPNLDDRNVTGLHIFFPQTDADITTLDGCRVRCRTADFVGGGGGRGGDGDGNRRNCIRGHIRICPAASNHIL